MSKKTAIVTGATGGMGKKIVQDLTQDHHVFAISRSASECFRGWDNVTAIDLDLVDCLDSGFDLPEFDSVDVLVHAAAQAQKFSVASAQVADWRFYMDLNVHAPAELTRLLLPAVKNAGGMVIFINSGAGKHSYGDNVIYAATKHALYALADGLRLAEKDIRVSTVAPGPTDTDMLKGLKDYDPAEVIAPVDVARAIRAVVDSGPSVQMTEVQVRPRVE